MRWEVSSERRGEGKRKGADIPEGRMVGKKLMHAKGGAGRKTGRRGTKVEDEEREGKGEREEREYKACIWSSYK